MPLKLINPQPMETLPTNGWVFAEDITHAGSRVFYISAADYHDRYYDREWFRFVAWSYTATFEEEEL